MEDFCLAPLPITFEPHWADERMLWLTGASIVVTAVLGWLAYWNGRKAGKIAEDASTREADRLDNEDKRRIQAARDLTAFAMLEVLVALSDYTWTNPGTSGKWENRNREMLDSKRQTALARIDIHQPPGDDELREWFDQGVIDIINSCSDFEKPGKELEPLIVIFRNGVRLWLQGTNDCSELPEIAPTAKKTQK